MIQNSKIRSAVNLSNTFLKFIIYLKMFLNNFLNLFFINLLRSEKKSYKDVQPIEEKKNNST